MIRRLFSLALLALSVIPLADAVADDRRDLSLAIRQGSLESVRAIVARNPQLVTTGDDGGYTPLHIAATAGRLEIIEFLLQRGAPLEARTAAGQTPLFQTVPLGQGPAFDLLLSRGARLDTRDGDRRSILQYALAWRRPAMAELILRRGFPLDATGAEALTLLEDAADVGLEAVVAALAEKGVPITTAARRGATMLHRAARGGLQTLCQQLLDRGAAIDQPDRHGLTALHLAAFYGRADVVRLLLSRGANPGARAPDGRTPRDLAQYADQAGAAALLPADPAHASGWVFPDLRGSLLGQPEPGLTPEVFAPGIVSSEEHETNLSFRPDGRELCLSRISAGESRRWLLLMRMDGDRWEAPTAPPFASPAAEFECSYAPDGSRMFFASTRPLTAGGAEKRDMDVWAVERRGDGWGEPHNLGPAINGPSNEYMPTADRKGTLYFERFGLNASRLTNGEYETAQPVPAAGGGLVSPGHPFIAPDGSYLLFDARRPGSGKSLLYVAFRLAEGSWSAPARLFPGVEPEEYEACPTVSPDGRFVFFGRDHDIYWASAEVIARQRRP